MYRSFKSCPFIFFLLISTFLFLPSFPISAPGQEKTPTAEQIAETVVVVYGSRNALNQIRRNGIERGRLTRINADGRAEESTYERRFIRGEATAKDRVRLDQKLPSAEYALVYGSGTVWGIVGNSIFSPREEAKSDFLSTMWHDLEGLLRYKENASTLALVGKEKHKNIDMWVLDVVDAEKRSTRYYISSQTYRVLWLEYEQPSVDPQKPNKFRKTFHDYRVAQQTLVPFRSVLFQNGSQVSQRQVLTVTYGVKMDESLFRNAEASNASLKNQ
ncbi:MAG: hypothetical protein WKF84_06665 [Pyrinomonadaceae bacterium]